MCVAAEMHKWCILTAHNTRMLHGAAGSALYSYGVEWLREATWAALRAAQEEKYLPSEVPCRIYRMGRPYWPGNHRRSETPSGERRTLRINKEYLKPGTKVRKPNERSFGDQSHKAPVRELYLGLATIKGTETPIVNQTIPYFDTPLWFTFTYICLSRFGYR